jgi:predicted transcriptional regulator with HTH domain
MAQFTFIPSPERKSSLADALQALASGYVSQRYRQSEMNKMSQGLQGLGFSPEESRSLSTLPEPLLQTILKGLGQRGMGGGSSMGLQSISPETQQSLAQISGVSGEQIPGQASSQQSMQPQMTIRDILGQPTLHEQRENKKLALKERQINQQEIREAYKATSPYRTKIYEEASSAKNVLDDLKRMKELETGDASLDTPGYVEFLERSGFDIPALMKPESEEFQKLRQTQLRDARQYFGGRVTNFEMDQFLKSIPSLNQSPEGRKRVIANMERINKLKVKTAETARKIIKANGGIPPLDLQEQIDEKMEPERERVAQEFKQDLKRKVPAAQNQYTTAIQAGLGSVIGAPGKLLGKIGNIGAALM